MEAICNQCNKLKKDVYNGKCQTCYRKNLINLRRIQAPKIQCACGCGELIPSISSTGKTQIYKNNHHNRGSSNCNYKGGRTIDSYGYVKILSPNHPFKDSKGYVKEHRLVMEQHLGRYLTKDEIVHHINEDKQDNRVENLQLTDRTKHQNHHNPMKDKRLVNMTGRICVLCNTDNPGINSRNGKPHWLRYEDGFICRNCYYKEQRRKKK